MSDAADECTQQAENRLREACSLDLTPPQISERIKRYCIGQDATVDTLAVSVYQHLIRCRRHTGGWAPFGRRWHIPPTLLMGPSGCGKSTLIRAIGRTTRLPVHGLKFMAHLLQSEDRRQAGMELDAALDRTADNMRSCLIQGCYWYLALCVIGLLIGAILALLHPLIKGL